MKRPVWMLQIERTTNAPFETVRSALLAGTHPWHPRPGRHPWRVGTDAPDTLELEQREAPCWGVEEDASYRVEPFEDRLLLIYRARFKGWPVLLLMGYWRIRSHRIWERFVESL